MTDVVIYLLHFREPYRHARHYVGSADNLTRRLELHRNGQGARLLEVIQQVGIVFDLVRVWRGPRRLERVIKNQKHGPRLCPVCRGQISGPELVALMSVYGVRNKELARRLVVSKRRVRQARCIGLDDPERVRAWVQTITGTDPEPAPVERETV